MQIMPATGVELKFGNVNQLEPNIHAGVNYIRCMIDQYYAKEPMTPLDRTLFAFTSYNAGPNRMQSLRREAARCGLDPNRWFRNVESVTTEKVGQETVTYVSNIYKYYVAHTLLAQADARKQEARDAIRPAAHPCCGSHRPSETASGLRSFRVARHRPTWRASGVRQGSCQALRLRDSAVGEMHLVVLVYGVGIWFVWRHYLAIDRSSWFAAPGPGHLQLRSACWWYFLVSPPLCQFILVPLEDLLKHLLKAGGILPWRRAVGRERPAATTHHQIRLECKSV